MRWQFAIYQLSVSWIAPFKATTLYVHLVSAAKIQDGNPSWNNTLSHPQWSTNQHVTDAFAHLRVRPGFHTCPSWLNRAFQNTPFAIALTHMFASDLGSTPLCLSLCLAGNLPDFRSFSFYPSRVSRLKRAQFAGKRFCDQRTGCIPP